MPAPSRTTATAQKRALVVIQADLRRLAIIKTNQDKVMKQMQQLLARYNQSETLANNVRKKVNDSVKALISKLG